MRLSSGFLLGGALFALLAATLASAEPTEPDTAEPAAAATTEPDTAEPAAAATTEPDTAEPAAAATTEPDTAEPAAAATTEPDTAEPAAAATTEPDTAEPATPEASQTVPAAGSSGPALEGRLELALQDAIAMALENNLDVQIVRHDPPIADHEHSSAWGAYDPNLYGDYEYASTETPVANSLQAGGSLTEREITGAAGLRGLIPKLGWQYDLSYSGRSLESTSSIQSLSPEYRANLVATATLPLLKGFLWGAPWVQVKLTGIGSRSAFEDFRRTLINIVSGIEGSYWDLAARRQDLEVALKSLETARELLEQTNAQYEVGVVSRVEVVEAEAGVADREFRRVEADARFGTSQDALIDQVLGPNLAPTTQLEVVPTDPADRYTVYEVDAEEAAMKAFEHRPELALARFATDQRKIQLKFAKNERLPQLDLRGSWGLQGLAGKTNSAPDLFGGSRAPLGVPRSYSRTDDDFFRGDQNNQWSAGALLSIPIGNRTGRNDVRVAELELRKSHTQLLRQEQQIILEIRKAIRDLRSSLEGIAAADKGSTAAQEQLRAERIRLEHGESTPFDVLQREEDLVTAESQRIFALQAYQSSVTALDRAQGTILRDRNIVIDDALALR